MKIYFLYHSKAFWPSWQSFYEACVLDPRISVKIIYCPAKKQAEGFGGQFDGAEEFLKTRSIPYKKIDTIDWISDKPDVLVMQTPYDQWHREEKYNSKKIYANGY